MFEEFCIQFRKCESMRRLPVYLLLDCSESMAGPGIEELQKGVNRLIDEYVFSYMWRCNRSVEIVPLWGAIGALVRNAHSEETHGWKVLRQA